MGRSQSIEPERKLCGTYEFAEGLHICARDWSKRVAIATITGEVVPVSTGVKRLPYMPGLDGLRAIAVLAVFVYHFHNGGGWLPGGFLGVDVFFVISGYLITSLLLSEFRKEGRVDLVAFW